MGELAVPSPPPFAALCDLYDLWHGQERIYTAKGGPPLPRHLVSKTRATSTNGDVMLLRAYHIRSGQTSANHPACLQLETLLLVEDRGWLGGLVVVALLRAVFYSRVCMCVSCVITIITPSVPRPG